MNHALREEIGRFLAPTFTVEELPRRRSANSTRSPGLQNRLIRGFKKLVNAYSWRDAVTVIHDHDHDPEGKPPEEPALYTGPKIDRLGRHNRNGAVDVLARYEAARTVPLSVEVAPMLDPKEF